VSKLYLAKCADCGYCKRVRGSRQANAGGSTTTIACSECQDLQDVRRWDVRKSCSRIRDLSNYELREDGIYHLKEGVKEKDRPPKPMKIWASQNLLFG
jgi:hypothetical protein